MEAVEFESGGLRLLTVVLLPVVCPSFYGWDVTDGLEQSAMIEPVDPFECSQFDGLAGWPAPEVDHFGLVQTVARLG